MSRHGAMVMAGAVVATPVAADIAMLPPLRDTTIYEDPAGGLSNGAGPVLFVGRNSGSLSRRSLLWFDVAGAVPAGATINSAILTLNMSQGNTPVTAVSLHRALAVWGEGASVAGGAGGGGGAAQAGDATWLHRFHPGILWTAPGGDLALGASASTPVAGPGIYDWSSPILAADVQAMLDQPALNFGWFMVGDESAASTAKRFDSREHADPALRPALVIDYTPVPAPGAALAIGGMAMPGLWRRRRTST